MRGALRRLGARRRSVRGDGGWLSLEFVGMTFLLLFVLMAFLQVAAATYTMAQANGAARAAARAATLGLSAPAAAQSAVNPSLLPVATSGGSTGDGQEWSVTLQVPDVFVLLPQWQVTRTASMPSTEPLGG